MVHSRMAVVFQVSGLRGLLLCSIGPKTAVASMGNSETVLESQVS